MDGWKLEDKPFLLGSPIFQGQAVSFREGLSVMAAIFQAMQTCQKSKRWQTALVFHQGGLPVG